MSLINAVRGEVRALLGGAPRTLCLTLGAMAELESAFGVDGLPALAERLRRLSAADLLIVLAALLRGGGETEAAEGLAGARIDLAEAAEAIAAAFQAASA